MNYKIYSLVVCLMGSAAVADTWTVDVNGSGHYESIQAAIDASSDGDDIQVMPGIYVIPLNEVVNTNGLAIWINSTDGPEVTIIDGEGVRGGIACVTEAGSETIIEGFTVESCSRNSGAGIYCEGSSPTIKDCYFQFNVAEGWGGGAYCYDGGSPMFDSCTFDNNQASTGGGMGVRDAGIVLLDCVFNQNTAMNSSGDGGAGGGGNHVDRSSTGAAQIAVGHVEDALIVGIGVDRVHHAFDDAEGFVQYLRHRCQTVRRARSIGHNLVLGHQELVIDAEHDGEVLTLGRGGDHDLLGAGAKMSGRLVTFGEKARRLDHDPDTELVPGQLAGVPLAVGGDPLAIDDETVAISADVAIETTMG